MKEFEIRSSEISCDHQKLIGYVVRWNSQSKPLWDFVEQFTPNAFAESLAEGQDVRALFEHDHTKLLGRTAAGTLSLVEDNIGLRFELVPPDTTLGRDLLVSVERGDISGMSFGFRTLSDSWDFEQEPMLRTINRAELVEITITSIPAYPESSVQIAKRSMAEARKQQNPTALYQRWADLAEV
ncbi:HK97 family phage prohead protease [Testudinibacter sp. TR-2022]|uniref:HK97 family phage prohead protease n=1 Tax=Testudinibacter sp. TR-2022 TaxID=2585029 RepID=UPI0011192D49|nr:HK97 family phage prohead protease [Testudinibacter sp. TR-2022]TNH04315.1 HK97 family phage prohead protease [Pasteurellaceae bacterium Phil31]TNH05746.1 HK97 family phage prohead protease [Testudinibacter sp. TR-2022]TNH07488.1 HK97 family phage prohead protease [Testudinibacter sp. TR-2022]